MNLQRDITRLPESIGEHGRFPTQLQTTTVVS
ncbi:hypothetical protein J2802_007692 [Paraburkholderia caribensis]|jgi:hypothetical protein|nr:hypothetical protein [Paraburkholderia caribensis]